MENVTLVLLMPPGWPMSSYNATFFALESWRNEISNYKLPKIQVSGSAPRHPDHVAGAHASLPYKESSWAEGEATYDLALI